MCRCYMRLSAIQVHNCHSPSMRVCQTYDLSNGDGNTFRPERWEEDYIRRQKEGIKFPSNDYSFITFSAGVRPCIGRHMSLMEMKAVLFHLVFNFDLSLPENLEEFEHGDPRKLKFPLLTMKENVDVCISVRVEK